MIKTCNKCISNPENFSSLFQPLSLLYRHKWHVHSSGRGFVVYKDDFEEGNREIRESLGISNGKS
jgi:hypothetical protein